MRRGLLVLVACNSQLRSACARLERAGGVASQRRTAPRVVPATARQPPYPARPMHHAITTQLAVTGH
jgi:hypothetical protein